MVQGSPSQPDEQGHLINALVAGILIMVLSGAVAKAVVPVMPQAAVASAEHSEKTRRTLVKRRDPERNGTVIAVGIGALIAMLFGLLFFAYGLTGLVGADGLHDLLASLIKRLSQLFLPG